MLIGVLLINRNVDRWLMFFWLPLVLKHRTIIHNFLNKDADKLDIRFLIGDWWLVMLIGVLLIGRNADSWLMFIWLVVVCRSGDPIHVSSSRSKDSISFIAKVSPLLPFISHKYTFVSHKFGTHINSDFFYLDPRESVKWSQNGMNIM